MAEFSIFGEMDSEAVEKISDNPYEIENNWYLVNVTKSYITSVEDKFFWNITYSIFEPDTKFHGRVLRDRFEVFPHAKSQADLEPDQIQSQERMKQRLAKGFGLITTEEQMKYGNNIEDLIGWELYLKVVNNPGKIGTDNEGRMFPNIRDASKDAPSGAATSSASSSIGL